MPFGIFFIILWILRIVHRIAPLQENATDLTMIDDVIRMSLGEDALLYLNTQEISIAALQEIMKTIMAAMADMSLEESEQQAKKK